MTEVERFIQALLNNIDGFNKTSNETLTLGDLAALLQVTQGDLDTQTFIRTITDAN